MKKVIFSIFLLFVTMSVLAKDHYGITAERSSAGAFCLISNGKPAGIVVDASEKKGVAIAANNLAADFQRVCGTTASVGNNLDAAAPAIVVGTTSSPLIKKLLPADRLKELGGKWETYIITTVPGGEGRADLLLVAGSDMRGAIYGIYEISEQIGVSPWYDWADVPAEKHQNLWLAAGTYTAGEPAVKYRGLFINDEAPCLTSWVKNTYGTNYGDHRFYARVFELILRLRGNYLWPAMWGWSFYADDPLNSPTASEMGVIMGTSHHEPMARNHQEWARHRNEYGEWNYSTNKQVLDKFFTEGMQRAKNTEDIITIGMRGDGDAPLGGKEGHDDEYVSQDELIMRQLTDVIANQRKIIQKVTGQKPEKRVQMWALYKEVQKYYDLGLKVPDDVMILLSDDNWGDVRRLPNAEERKRKGGWGMYYHVDYVGAPRNSKWLNVTPIQNIWEQLSLTYQYGVDKLWILNVGDIKPMEYPISLFMSMAWRPEQYCATNLLDHTRLFCQQQFGEKNAAEAARLLNLYSKYNGRITPEMLDRETYNLAAGEWKQVRDGYMALEAEAVRLSQEIDAQHMDAYKQIILFPIQAMANLYDMYYSQAENHRCYRDQDSRCNDWADRVEKAFKRDSLLCLAYNKDIAGGKWDGMMTQKHIGYRSWNDNFPRDIMPRVFRLEAGAEANAAPGGFVFNSPTALTVIEAQHFFSATDAADARWTIIPYMGRTLSAVSLQPYNKPFDGAALTYKFRLPNNPDSVKVRIALKSTLPFQDAAGHRFIAALDDDAPQSVNYNGNLNEQPENIYSVYYPTVARRVVEAVVTLPVSRTPDGYHLLTLRPQSPAVVFEKIIIDDGSYQPSYLFGQESPYVKSK